MFSFFKKKENSKPQIKVDYKADLDKLRQDLENLEKRRVQEITEEMNKFLDSQKDKPKFKVIVTTATEVFETEVFEAHAESACVKYGRYQYVLGINYYRDQYSGWHSYSEDDRGIFEKQKDEIRGLEHAIWIQGYGIAELTSENIAVRLVNEIIDNHKAFHDEKTNSFIPYKDISKVQIIKVVEG